MFALLFLTDLPSLIFAHLLGLHILSHEEGQGPVKKEWEGKTVQRHRCKVAAKKIHCMGNKTQC